MIVDGAVLEVMMFVTSIDGSFFAMERMLG